MKVERGSDASGNPSDADGNAEQTDAMVTDATEDPVDGAEQTERGSDAVERRIEKVIADLHDQGVLDAADEKAVETKRVGLLKLCSLYALIHVFSRRWLLLTYTLPISVLLFTHATTAPLLPIM